MNKKVIYILGISRCGSTALSFALGNHDDVRNLGETTSWFWGASYGKSTTDYTPMEINLSELPLENIWIDASKSVWRLAQWRNSANLCDIKVIWLIRSPWKCAMSRKRFTGGEPNRSIVKLLFKSYLWHLVNWAYLWLYRIPHVTVYHKRLMANDLHSKWAIEDHVGYQFHNLYGEYRVSRQHIIAGNQETGNKPYGALGKIDR